MSLLLGVCLLSIPIAFLCGYNLGRLSGFKQTDRALHVCREHQRAYEELEALYQQVRGTEQ